MTDPREVIERREMRTPWHYHNVTVSVWATAMAERWGWAWSSNKPGLGGMPIDTQRSETAYATAAEARLAAWADVRDHYALLAD